MLRIVAGSRLMPILRRRKSLLRQLLQRLRRPRREKKYTFTFKVLLPQWREQMRKQGLSFSRQQWLQSLVPQGGVKGVKDKILRDSKEVEM